MQKPMIRLTFTLLTLVLASPAPAAGPPPYLYSWGTGGSGDGQFLTCMDAAVGAAGNVYVTDLQNQRVQVFSSDGTFLFKWGSYGQGPGQFYNPTGIALDAAGNVYMAEQFNDRVQKFSASGEFLTMWGSGGVDSVHGIVVVGDDGLGRVRAFDTGGNHLWDIVGFDLGLAICPSGVALGPDGSLYVVDQCAYGRVLKFGPVPVQTTSQTWGRIKGSYR